MKAALYFLAVFCLVMGGLLSLNASTEFMSWWMFAWAVGSYAAFGALAITFPER